MDIFLGRVNAGRLTLEIDGAPVAVSEFDKVVLTMIPVSGGTNIQIDSADDTGTIDTSTDGELLLTLGVHLETVTATAEQYYVEVVGITGSSTEQLVSKDKDCITFDVYETAAVTVS